MENTFKVSYVTTLPKEGNAPRIIISGDQPHKYKVSFFERLPNQSMNLICEGFCEVNQTLICKSNQWFTNWVVEVRDESDRMIYKNIFSLEDNIVQIKMDAWALGDNIAWMPYIDEFRKKYNCKVVCSTFYNDLFINAYPEILFVKPNTIIENLYAQYYIGASDGNIIYSPLNTSENPLQRIACAILGLEYHEIRPDLTINYAHIPPRVNRKYVTLSEYGSSDTKHWKAENGWQAIVDYLNNKGYLVFVISKEPTNLINAVDLTGDINLEIRASDILHADFHLGISSGLSWLAWALGKHVVMISDVTPNWHEFQTNITRLNANDLSKIDYLAEGQTTIEEVIKKLEESVLPRYL